MLSRTKTLNQTSAPPLTLTIPLPLNAAGGHHQRGRHDGGAVLVLHRGVHREGESGGVQGIVRLISSTQRVPFISLLSHRYINHTEEIN